MEDNDNIIYFDSQQGDIVSVCDMLKAAAQRDEIQCLFISAIDSDGILKMGRAGGFNDLQDFLLLLGGFDVHKDYVMQKMIAVEHAEAFEEEEYDEED